MKGTSMTTATTTKPLESKETVSLIASDNVEGTAVYGTDQKKIGKLERVMIDKLSGKVAYAVFSFCGFMGMGEDFYPMPWSTLKYDTNLGGYRDRKSTRLNSSHLGISYAVFCLKKKK